MNSSEEKYTRFALVREMLETPGIIKNFNPDSGEAFISAISRKRALFLTGEGSSRIFPAKRAIYHALKKGLTLPVLTEGATQALEYDLKDYAVFAASNSGKTKEVIRLVSSLAKKRHKTFFGLTANPDTKLEEIAALTHVLKCGKENAVAATKSVIEQGLFYDSLLRLLAGEKMTGLDTLSLQVNEALTKDIDPSITRLISSSEIIYWAGRNNGAAEELSLNTNEITRKKSAFLEGTFAVHGIEEVMNPNEILIWIEPFEEEIEKFSQSLIDGVGMKIIAVATKQTKLPTIIIPDGGEYAEYVQLAAGWNILVEAGVALGIDTDKPRRARKVGNEYLPGR
jgi:glucosamine--fructose-6-phosphate aminotransferase (isomerizing)